MSALTISITYTDDEDWETTIDVPGKYEVCSTCNGKGTHVNPAIDGNGLTARDFDEDPDFHEAYMRGDYDIQCTKCEGLRVKLVPDEEKMDKDVLIKYQAWRAQQYAIEKELAYESRQERWLEGRFDY